MISFGLGDGEFDSAPITSLSDILGPEAALCHGGGVVLSCSLELSSEGWFTAAAGREGRDASACPCSCCCRLRSLCDTLAGSAGEGLGERLPAVARPEDKLDVRLEEAWSIISFIPSFEVTMLEFEDHGFDAPGDDLLSIDTAGGSKAGLVDVMSLQYDIRFSSALLGKMQRV